MTIRLSDLDQVYLVCGKIDMRQGIDSLAYLDKSQFNLDSFSGQVYLFCGGRKYRFILIRHQNPISMNNSFQHRPMQALYHLLQLVNNIIKRVCVNIFAIFSINPILGIFLLLYFIFLL